MSADLRIGWEELLGVPFDPKNYVGLVSLLDPETPHIDELLLVASQLYEESVVATNTELIDDGLNELFLEASQVTDHLVTAMTRMYDAQVDEATIMSRTGHRSGDGVRAYKKTSDKLRDLSDSNSYSLSRNCH